MLVPIQNRCNMTYMHYDVMHYEIVDCTLHAMDSHVICGLFKPTNKHATTTPPYHHPFAHHPTPLRHHPNDKHDHNDKEHNGQPRAGRAQ